MKFNSFDAAKDILDERRSYLYVVGRLNVMTNEVRGSESDTAARDASDDGLIGLLLLRQAVTTRTVGQPQNEIYEQARDSAVNELRYRLRKVADTSTAAEV